MIKTAFHKAQRPAKTKVPEPVEGPIHKMKKLK